MEISQITGAAYLSQNGGATDFRESPHYLAHAWVWTRGRTDRYADPGAIPGFLGAWGPLPFSRIARRDVRRVESRLHRLIGCDSPADSRSAAATCKFWDASHSF